jgi:acetyl esterase/lipase
LHLDVYAPKEDLSRRRATIVWLHPGGFTKGDKSVEAPYARDFAQRGYVSIAIDYRLRPTLQWFDVEQRVGAAADAYEDATTSIRWLRRNASRYGIDPAHIFVAGYSAGAIIAQDVATPPDGSRSLVVGAMSIAGYPNGTARRDQPPRLLFHGTRDFLVPYEQDMAGCTQARKFQNRCELVTIVNGEHDIGFVKLAYITDRTARFFAPIANGK